MNNENLQCGENLLIEFSINEHVKRWCQNIHNLCQGEKRNQNSIVQSPRSIWSGTRNVCEALPSLWRESSLPNDLNPCNYLENHLSLYFNQSKSFLFRLKVFLVNLLHVVADKKWHDSMELPNCHDRCLMSLVSDRTESGGHWLVCHAVVINDISVVFLMLGKVSFFPIPVKLNHTWSKLIHIGLCATIIYEFFSSSDQKNEWMME